MAEFLYLYRGSERVTAGMSPQQMQDYLQRFAGWIGSLSERQRLSTTSCAPLEPTGKTLTGPGERSCRRLLGHHGRGYGCRNRAGP